MFVCKSRELRRISIGRLISLGFLKILRESRGRIENFPTGPPGGPLPFFTAALMK